MNTRALSVILILLLCLFTSHAYAASCVTSVVYDGKGAGAVTFNYNTHVAKGLICADCHEPRGSIFPLFEMQRGANSISMRKLENGRSCGYCHDGKQTFGVTGDLNCEKCHRK